MMLSRRKSEKGWSATRRKENEQIEKEGIDLFL
jgi:hypothetical protein